MQNTRQAYKIIVKGIVQGVGFRYFTKQFADGLNVFGTVQNLRDGSVQIFVCGQSDKVLEFVEWCHNGPPSAKVDSLNYEPTSENNFVDFKIVR